jgi:hypothetical protein
MVARFLYRLVSLIFFATALLCWFLVIGGLVVQFGAQGFNLEAFCMSIMSAVLAFLAHQASIEAWRAARTHRRDPLWSHYP